MNRRLVLAGVAIALLAVTAGCTMPFFGNDSFDDDRLDQAPPGGDYAWNETDARVTIWVLDGSFWNDGGRFKAIYDMNGTEKLKLFRRDIWNKHPLGIRAVRYRYPNGTVINGSQLSIEKGDENAVIEVPDANGSVAVTAGAEFKHFQLPTYIDGSYEVILPPDRRTGFPIFGDVSPGADNRFRDDQGRVHLEWEDVSGQLSVRYYLQRDLYVFGGAVLLILLVGGGGALYYYRQIQALKEIREELGLDVDTGDDEFDQGPPPGMQ
jgi:hypothetical protein